MEHSTDRRKFIKNSVAAAAAVSVFPSEALARASSESERAALGVIQAFFDAANKLPAADMEGIRDACNFPHVRIASGTVRIWQKRHEMTGETAERLAREGRAAGRFHSVRFVHSSADKVHVAYVFDRYKADGSRYATFETLWIITKQDDHWGVQCRSSFAP